MNLSRRVSSLAPSATVAVANRAKQLRREGVDVLSFAAGEPDFDTPHRIKQAAIDALLAGQTKYMPTAGDPETRAVIADKLLRENGIPGVTPNHILISAGGKQALYALFMCLFDPPPAGDPPMELILPTPAWVSYAPHAELAGGRVVEVPTTPESGFLMSPDQLRAAITPRSRALVLNSPSNPTGAMYSETQLRALAAVVAESAASVAPDLVVITDEIYEKIVFSSVRHFSIGSVPEIAERTITINGLSKAFAMTGWRAGYAAGSGGYGARLIGAMATLQGQMTTNITAFVYPAIRTALTQCDEDVERMRLAFAGRARLAHDRICDIPGIRCPAPQGAFYLFPDVSGLLGRRSPAGREMRTPFELAEALLEEAKLAFVPGEDFGGCGDRCVRISFACSEDQINAGMDRLAQFVRNMR